MIEDVKRGRAVALRGLALQVALVGLLCVVWLGSKTPAGKAVFFLLAGGLAIWIVTTVLFVCRHLADLEALELDQLAGGDTEGFFGEHAAEMRLAQRRLALMTRFVCPAVTLVLSAYLLGTGAWLLAAMRTGTVGTTMDGSPLTWAFACLGGAFLAFLFSRYAIGMAKDPQWRLLRAGGSYLTVSALASGLLCVAMFLAHTDIRWPLWVLPYVVPVIMMVVGAECLLNLILDFYRPRKPGVQVRPGFDSRLANMLAEPGDVAHSIAEALNYQFGFEVSSTWFYQLLRKTLVPLLIFGAMALVAVSCIVIVSAGQQAVVLTCGKAPANRAVLNEGIHVKWPWPIQTADILEARRVHTLTVGVGVDRAEHGAADDGPGPSEHEEVGDVINGVTVRLWKQEHGDRQEYDFMAPREDRQGQPARDADRPGSVAPDESGPSEDMTARQYGAVALVRMVMALHYTVEDVYKFYYGVTDAETLLADLATRELTRYAARRDIDTLISSQRDLVARDLREAIMAAVKTHDLGVKLVLVSPHGIHPPTTAATAFEEVIKADLERVGKRLAAEVTAEATLSTVAGSSDLAVRLAEAAARIEPLRAGGASAQEVAEAERLAERLLDECGGQAKTLVNQMRASRWRQVNEVRGLWESFNNQLAAYLAAPRLFTINEKLRVLSTGLKEPRKYVIGIDPDRLEIRFQDDRRTIGSGFTMEARE